MPTKCQDSNPLLEGVLYAEEYYTKGGYYMLVDTVAQTQEANLDKNTSQCKELRQKAVKLVEEVTGT